MKNHTVLKVLLSFVLFTLVCSCGGGGGGGDGEDESSGSETLKYSGITEQALITEENAEKLAINSLSIGATSSSPGLVTMSAQESSPEQMPLAPAQVLTSIMRTIEAESFKFSPSGITTQAVYEETDTIYGECGGSASLNMIISDDTGIFNGSVIYSSYCELGSTINGSANFSGEVDLDYFEFVSFYMEFDRLTVSSTEESYTISGNVDMGIINNWIDMSMNAVILDNLASKTYRIQNFILSITDNYSWLEMEISGRFYDPDYGYVILSTLVPLQIGYYDSTPGSGQILLTGRDATLARLTVLDSYNCEVEADLDGDGSYDIISGPIAW